MPLEDYKPKNAENIGFRTVLDNNPMANRLKGRLIYHCLYKTTLCLMISLIFFKCKFEDNLGKLDIIMSENIILLILV